MEGLGGAAVKEDTDLRGATGLTPGCGCPCARTTRPNSTSPARAQEPLTDWKLFIWMLVLNGSILNQLPLDSNELLANAADQSPRSARRSTS
jgi:hypothetical protein